MDYCSSCRRHLNGALVCPGCGAYAPDIAPRTTASTPVRTAGPAATRPVPAPVPRVPDAFDAWQDRGPRSETAAPPTVPEALEAPEAPETPSGASRGRAARRRQLARWKKNKRRAAVATAVALVGGGLTLTAMERQSGDRAQAATAPDNRPMGGTGEQTAEEPPPPSAPSGTHRSAPSPRTAAPGQADDRAVHRSSGAAAPRTAAPDTRPDAAATPRPVATPAAPHRSAAPVGGATTAPGGSAAAAAPRPSTPSAAAPSTPPASSGGTDPSGGSGSQSGASAPATSPAHLCLLVVCLS
ncbi:hypothetical protein ACIQ6V_06795 [Streptomyces sp. NPDC096198]|uniref:SCO2400 family protein n=1 Tax=Streptomyces sp. NPDC096198 TaxID=3366080 RepID=UPI0037F4392C